MNKLKLDFEDLKVESFETSPEPEEDEGTAYGLLGHSDTSCLQIDCQCPTGTNTCATTCTCSTCGGSCNGGCGSGNTFGSTCPASCTQIICEP